ncbi:hypothetical protein B9Z55_007860 [Caenorhabditis nigoni]|uniref:Uncharacterized protein n=1 Tax=Caenorhabditis nigoni TaxID=1611254 RepID=A0A2G5VBJ6_9PELO|nr:hypothetical protein B9Z55_007860 [Caenorhabditis nigoni]
MGSIRAQNRPTKLRPKVRTRPSRDVVMDRTVDDEIDEPVEEEYEVDVVEPEEKSAQNPMIFFVAIVILAFFILWYFMCIRYLREFFFSKINN